MGFLGPVWKLGVRALGHLRGWESRGPATRPEAQTLVVSRVYPPELCGALCGLALGRGWRPRVLAMKQLPSG